MSIEIGAPQIGGPGVDATVWFAEKALVGIWNVGVEVFKAVAPALPDMFSIAAMGCLLVGMCGFDKALKMSGSFMLLAVLGVLINVN